MTASSFIPRHPPDAQTVRWAARQAPEMMLDLLDYLATTMGLDARAAQQYLRAFGDSGASLRCDPGPLIAQLEEAFALPDDAPDVPRMAARILLDHVYALMRDGFRMASEIDDERA